MGFFDNLKEKIGFGPQWEDEETYGDEEMNPQLDNTRRSYSYDSPYGSGASAGAVRRRVRTPDLERASAVSGTQLRSMPIDEITGEAIPSMRIYNARPTTFAEAGEVADRFKMGTPVVLDLSLASPDVRRRFIDFASGLTYGLDGGISKVAEAVFMLTPSNVEISESQRRRFGAPVFTDSI